TFPNTPDNKNIRYGLLFNFAFMEGLSIGPLVVQRITVLASTFPHKRKLHFWAKNSLFANKILNAILTSGGVVPVDRKTKNNKALFAATFEVLKLGEVVTVFPEGTSHSQSRLLEFKDGASWAVLEYASFVSDLEKSNGGRDDIDKKKSKFPAKAIVIPVGLTYVQKSKYRSLVIVAYGPPIHMESYLEDFEIDNRATVKRLTKHIETETEKLTINAPDWETSHAATIARQLIFSGDKHVPLEDYVKITQSLINFFANTISDEILSLKNNLIQYKTSLDELRLSNADIARYENRSLTIPWATYTFLRELLKFVVQLPFFLPGLCFHWPIYLLGIISAKYEIYEESRAQNKIALGLTWLLIAYSALFFFIWVTFFFTPLGFILAASAVFIFAWYHIALVDSHYDKFKKLISSFRLLAALCSGKGSLPRDQVENLKEKRDLCLGSLKKIGKEYRSKSDDLRIVLEHCERAFIFEGKKLR
ncbi:7528_t:CDS:2, partial [Funneliformis mosseae]